MAAEAQKEPKKVLLVGEPYFTNVVSQTFQTKRPEELDIHSTESITDIRDRVVESDVLVFQLCSGVEDAVTALKILVHAKYEKEKTFILVSSVQTWAETHPRADVDSEVEANLNNEDEEGDDAGEDDAQFTEDMYNMRVPHVKYQAWKEVEKLIKQANCPLLHTYVLFSGLLYGGGEDKLHPIFKQAWHLAPEGLPVFGGGKNCVPMIHVKDLSTFIYKLSTRERGDDAEPDDQRYFFATDQGNCTWARIIKAINDQMGNGKTYRVLERDFILYENVEHFIINLRVEAQGIHTLMEDEEEWVAQTGFIENVSKVLHEYKVARKVLPLRISVLGPPASGKTYYSRKLAEHFKLPHFTIRDIIVQYEQTENELRDELSRRKRAKRDAARRARLEEARAAGHDPEQNGEANQDGDGEEGDMDDPQGDTDLDNEDEPDEEEEEELDDEMEQIAERLRQVRAVLSMKVKPKPIKEAEEEKVGKQQQGKKKGAAVKKGAKPTKSEKLKDGDSSAPTTPDDSAKKHAVDEPPRYMDRCLALMYRWKLSQASCRNQGWVMDGFPKTVTQARLLMEEGDIEIPEEGDEVADGLEALPDGEEPELKKVEDNLLPDYVVCLDGTDQFLVERVMKLNGGINVSLPIPAAPTAESVITNASDKKDGTVSEKSKDDGLILNPAQSFVNRKYSPENFQRRLNFYKDNSKPLSGVATYLESVLTNSEALRDVYVRDFSVDSCSVVPPPMGTILEDPPEDVVFNEVMQFCGTPHNYGPTPQEMETRRMLDVQRRAEHERIAREEQAKRAKAELADKEILAQQQKEEAARLAAIQTQEREMLEVRKEPLKRYLMENVIPLLTKGLIEVCEQKPQDPIDYLAEWLFQHNPHID